MKRDLQIMISVGFMAVLAITGAVILFKEPKTYSENENRYLQAEAAPTWDTIFDSSWQEKITEYMSDQMPMRDAWTALQSKMQQCIGKKEVAGVFIGKNDYYFEKVTEADLSHRRLLANVQAVEALIAAMPQSELYFMPAPTAGNICADNLPAFAPYYAEDTRINLAFQVLKMHDCHNVDVRGALEDHYAVGEQLYFRTDHHWNTDGAFVAYQVYAQAAGLTPMAKESLNLQVVSESFRGTLDSKVLDSSGPTDIVTVPFSLPDVKVTADGENISVLEMGKLLNKDQYQVFFGGNYGQVTIETGAETGRSLLIFKDSYANCFVPFLLTHYDTITMIDLRYNDGSWMELIHTAPDDVLVLYEMSNFCKDMNLSTVPVALEQ